MMAPPPYLAEAPSHFNWDIDTGTAKEFDVLLEQIGEHLIHNPDAMKIQAMLFQSFLYTSKYKHPKPDIPRSRDYLQKALDEINKLDNEEEKIGYKIVVKCNEAYMDHTLDILSESSHTEIKELLSAATDLSHACIHSVRAFALSRVGINKHEESKLYYEKALYAQPENTQWLFGLALVTGRLARTQHGAGRRADGERKLYEKILKIDKNHALAHAFLAYNLVLIREDKDAKRHAFKARELAPKHPHILTRVGMVLRKAKQYKDALKVFTKANIMLGKHSILFHQMGLVYRDMYDAENSKKKEAIKMRKRWRQPNKDLIEQAIVCFTTALEANQTNNMALYNRALQYERLREFEKAEDDFLSALSTTNVDPGNKVLFNSVYGSFLVRSLNKTEIASKHFKAAIACAVEYCTKYPITRKNPKPIFDKAIYMDLNYAKSGYKDIMKQKIRSSNNEENSAGLRGLAWFHQVLGEHDVARKKYIEYLNCDGKSDDHDAIFQLTKCLLHLEDFEEARNKIQDLRNLNKTDLAQTCLIECALQQGKNAADENQVKLARDLFIEAVDAGSMEGCEKLADILRKDADVSSLNFRQDCAKILNCCKLNDASNDPLCDDIRLVMDLKNADYGDLRNKHLTLEQVLLENQTPQITREILVEAAQIIHLSRSMLDRIMIGFRQKTYPGIFFGACTFFHIQQENTNQPKTEQQVKTEVLKKLMKTYKWVQFDSRFPELCDFLVKFQPAYPGNKDNWYIALHQLGNRDKHTDKIRYSHYHIPTILNGCKGIFAIPEGQPIYGYPFEPQTQEPRVTYELLEVVAVARKAAIEVERIVAEFHKNM